MFSSLTAFSSIRACLLSVDCFNCNWDHSISSCRVCVCANSSSIKSFRARYWELTSKSADIPSKSARIKGNLIRIATSLTCKDPCSDTQNGRARPGITAYFLIRRFRFPQQLHFGLRQFTRPDRQAPVRHLHGRLSGEKSFDDPIFQGMKTDHRHPPVQRQMTPALFQP